MKKSVIFLSLLTLGSFSCQFTKPTAIEIKGSPLVKFIETVDIGKMFIDLLDDAVNDDDKENMTFIPCRETIDFTYLIHMDVFTEEIAPIEDADEIGNLNLPGMELNPGHINDPDGLPENKILIDGSDERMILPLSEIGSLLTGFKFSEYHSFIYFSGSPIVNKAKVNIKIEEIEDGVETGEVKYMNDVPISNIKSNFDTWKEEDGYYEETYNSLGSPVDIPIEGKDIGISFTVFIPKGVVLELEDFKDGGEIKVEIVIWLPFVFTAEEGGAEIAFPKDAFFSSKDDLFGRDEPGAESKIADIIESLTVNIKFKINPFLGADLIILGNGIEVHNRITNNTVSFNLSEENMEVINDPVNWPFAPELKINFPENGTLRFPRIFNVTEFSFQAKMRYRIDL